MSSYGTFSRSLNYTEFLFEVHILFDLDFFVISLVIVCNFMHWRQDIEVAPGPCDPVILMKKIIVSIKCTTLIPWGWQVSLTIKFQKKPHQSEKYVLKSSQIIYSFYWSF